MVQFISGDFLNCVLCTLFAITLPFCEIPRFVSKTCLVLCVIMSRSGAVLLLYIKRFYYIAINVK